MKLADIFQSGMTLQRNKLVKVWGTSTIEQFITVKLNDKEIGVYHILEGQFSIHLPTLDAATNVTLEIGDVTLKNVDIGEVWIAGGQSNMEFRLEYDAEGDEAIATANDEHLRCYTVEKYAFEGEREDGFKDESEWNKWLPYKPEFAAGFSAVGTYFASELRKSGVPVAIINCNWGGTSASTWLEKDLLLEDEELKTYVEDFDAQVKKLDLKKYYILNKMSRQSMTGPQYKQMMDFMHKNVVTPEMWNKLMADAASQRGVQQEASQIPEGLEPEDMTMENRMAIGPNDASRPGALYETMIKQIAGFSAKGVIWYQGESDDKKPTMYAKLFAKMIECWRRDWQDDLPFLFVQLAPFGVWRNSTGDNFPMVRSQQEKVSKTVKGTYMISTSDVGHELDVHPKYKRPVGLRLAACARNVIYGEDVIWQAPIGKYIEKEDDSILISFDHGEGLY